VVIGRPTPGAGAGSPDSGSDSHPSGLCSPVETDMVTSLGYARSLWGWLEN